MLQMSPSCKTVESCRCRQKYVDLIKKEEKNKNTVGDRVLANLDFSEKKVDSYLHKII